MKLTEKQQKILRCLAGEWNMIQAYDFPIRLTAKTYFMNSIPEEENCPKPTKDKLLELGLIEFTESNSIKFYRLTALGRKHANA